MFMYDHVRVNAGGRAEDVQENKKGIFNLSGLCMIPFID